MAYQCKGCDKIYDVPSKPRVCPGCQQQFKGWKAVVVAASAPAKRDTSDAPEWDNAATVAMTAASLVTGQTLDTLGGQHGFPSAACLKALYAAIEAPAGGKAAKSIYFNAFAANYDNDTSKLAKTSLASNTPYAINSTASQCAERGLWKSIGASLSGKTLLGIGQDTRPCLACCARFSALAASKNITIMVYFEKKYDALPGNTWLLFSPTVGTAGYTT